ncbi:MAG: MMPL family transporter, partial [Chloroflexota bacterium]|nr:MMPL family transporter [Chloroflexota bacterium]
MDVGTVSRFVLRHKAWVAGFWLAMVVVAVALMPTVFDRLSEDFSVPDTESNQAITELTGIYGNNGTSNPLVPVVTLTEG